MTNKLLYIVPSGILLVICSLGPGGIISLFLWVILFFVLLFAFQSKQQTKWFALVAAISFFAFGFQFLGFRLLGWFCSIILLAVALWNIFNDKKKKRSQVQTFTTNDLAQ